MKPSKFLVKDGYWIISNMPNVKLEDSEGYSVDSIAEELDKRFIDREELKKKISNKITDIYNCLGELSYTKKYRQIQEERIILLKEILKLLEE